MTTLAVALERIEHLNLVHLHVEEMSLSLVRSHDECGIGHVASNLLNDKAFGALGLVLVGTLRVDVVLPVSLALHVHGIALADVGHDVVDGLVDAPLTAARVGYETVHQCRFVLHIVCVFECGLIEVGTQ